MALAKKIEALEKRFLQKTVCFSSEHARSRHAELKPMILPPRTTLVPEVFLDFSPHERAVREPRSGEHKS